MAIGDPVVKCDMCLREKGTEDGWSVAAWNPADITFAASRNGFRDFITGSLPEDLEFVDLCGSECQHTALARWQAGEL
jgi:hypothetical protein